MLDLELEAPLTRPATPPAPPPRPASAEHASRRWLAAALDELDYGVAVLDAASRLLHANHAAHVELDGVHPLWLQGRQMLTRGSLDTAAFHGAVREAAERGLRRLLTIGRGATRWNVSIVPLDDAAGSDECNDGSTRAVLFVFAKRAVSETLSIEGYARSHALTAAETRVLLALCAGVRPLDVACRLGVAISTIRSQIGSIRAKTGASSIRAVVDQVALLPPVKGVLRCDVALAAGFINAADAARRGAF